MTLSNSDIAGVLNIKHKRGDTFIRAFTFTDSVPDPINLSGFTAKLEVRTRARNELGELLASASTPTEITISGAGNNVVTVTIPAASMLIIAGIHSYELELTSSGGVRTTYLKGNFEITQDVVA